MGRIPGKPIKTRITYYARPEIVKIIDDMIRAGKFNNKSDVISAAILDYSHNQDMDYVRELEEKYLLLEERLRLMEEKYASLISVFSSLESSNGDSILPKQSHFVLLKHVNEIETYVASLIQKWHESPVNQLKHESPTMRPLTL